MTPLDQHRAQRLTDNLADARNHLLRAYLCCDTTDRDRVGAIITELDQLLDGSEK